MQPDCRQGSLGYTRRIPSGILLVAGGFVCGCASPGPPRPPSLYIPRIVSDLAATRRGDAIDLRFTVPGLSTDGQPLRARALQGALCRQEVMGAQCRLVDTAETGQPIPVPGPGADPAILWTDPLPPALRSGNPRPIAYCVELKTPSGATAGYSDPVYAAAGTAPAQVSELRAEGTRVGVVLHWLPVSGAGEVLLRRVEPEKTTPPAHVAGREGDSKFRAFAPPVVSGPLQSSKSQGHVRGAHGGHAFAEKHADSDPGVLWLQAEPGVGSSAATIDNSIEPGIPYLYTAVRREHVQIGGRSLELESSPSNEVAITWRDIYPPASPTGLVALGYDQPAAPASQTPGYAVDLIWEPVEDGQLAGYLVFRQVTDPRQLVMPGPSQLTPQPLATPGFHDATVMPAQGYRYSVVAVGTNGQRSAPVSADVAPHAVP